MNLDARDIYTRLADIEKKVDTLVSDEESAWGEALIHEVIIKQNRRLLKLVALISEKMGVSQEAIEEATT